MDAVALTSLARAGGCAAKYSAARLETLLAGLVPGEAEDLLVGLDPADDAAVYRLDDDRAIVFTVDFFPPLVDDPRTFGGIAAVNALNDVFAMGGRPLLALSVAAFPEELPVEVLGEVLAGADERVREAGAILAGGHTIRDDEPKYGLAVVGTVHPQRIWAKAGARAGDVLFLTKPLGTGIVLQAQRDGLAPPGLLEVTIDSMLELNMAAAEALRPFEPNAVTDVTGFGLLGHAHELASRSGVRAVLDAGALPALPGALELAAEAFARGAIGETGTSQPRTSRATRAQPWRRSHSIRKRPAACSSPCPATGPPVFEAVFAAEGILAARIGRVEEGAGVVLELDGRCRRACPLGLGTDLRSASATASGVALFLVITSGAFVRLTGSGLGCENWPRCGDKPYPEQGFHAFVEFGNRMVALVGIVLTLLTWLASRRVHGLSRGGRWAALGAFLVAVAQIPMGGVTIVLDLHPLAVMTHFLLGLTAFGLAVIAAFEAWSLRDGLAPAANPAWLRWIVTLLRAPGVHRPARDRSRCHRFGAAPRLERRRRAARARHRGHRVRARPRRRDVRDRRSRRGVGPLEDPPAVPGAFPALGRPSPRARRSGDRGRGAVPERASVGSRPRSRDPGGRDLGVQPRAGVRALAAAQAADPPVGLSRGS